MIQSIKIDRGKEVVELPYIEDEDIVTYSARLSAMLLGSKKRESGGPYFDHCREVVDELSKVIKPSLFSDSCTAAGYLHDLPEEIDYVDVYDPVGQKPEKLGSVAYLNDLVRKAGSEGKWMCYIVDKLTRRDKRYSEYMDNILLNISPSESDYKRSLDILTIILKIADRHTNTNPLETRDVNDEVEIYAALKSASEEALKFFYRTRNVLDFFNRTGNYEYNQALFVEALNKNFEAKKHSNALDNIWGYLRRAEEKLLIDIKDSDLFDPNALRDLIKECYRNSMKITGLDYETVMRTGLHRGAQNPGYTSILRELMLEE
jgi:hypothetical protein